MPRLLSLISCLLALSGTEVHAAASHAATEQVQADLIASVDAVRPGQQIWLAVQQRIVPHWHTYWLNPGDSGTPTSISWSLPDGARAGEIQWPTPSRFSLGPVTNYGYAQQVMLLSAISVPQQAKVGSQFPVKAQVEWLVCREECLPQQVELSLSLPVIAAGAPAGPVNPLIKQALADLPVASPWPVAAKPQPHGWLLSVAAPSLTAGAVQDIWFYPSRWGVINHAAPQPSHVEGDKLLLSLQSGEAPLRAGDALEGLLVVKQRNGGKISSRSYSVNVLPAVAGPAAAPADSLGLASALLLALLGGMVLNLMPCVFPVLSIKALALLQYSQSPLKARLHGLAYTLGVLASFALLALVLILLKAGGTQIGWGFQFQSPLFVLAVAYLIFTVGLSLSGVFTVGGSIVGVGSNLAERSGYSGSFFTGVLATIVATPCTAPFMGAAVGYALAQSPLILLLTFLSLGLGVALPFLLLSIWPALQRRLPRPGAWMERVKQGLAFPMYAAAVWLVWVLAQQAGINAVAIALAGMVLISFACWLYETTKISAPLVRRSSVGIAALALLGAVSATFVGVNAMPLQGARSAAAVPQKGNWEAYQPERLQALRAQGKPVFVNLTAAWCISCLVNEKVALSQDSVQSAFREQGITYLKGDWTNKDARITQALAEFGRSGVPLYVFYPQGLTAKAVVLPQLLTPEIVLSTIRKTAVPL